MKSLTGKIALVTGASRGLGQAIANALAEQGAIIAGTATTQVGAEQITQRLKERDYQGKGFVMDVTDPR